MQAGPDVYEIVEVPSKRLLMGGQVRRVDSTGRHSGQNVRGKVGERARQMPENSDLVRGARTAAREHESEIGSFLRYVYSLRPEGPAAGIRGGGYGRYWIDVINGMG